MVSAKTLAEEQPDYRDLAELDTEIPTILLNKGYSPLKSYIQARAAELTDEGREQARERYAVGVGVGLLVLNDYERKESRPVESLMTIG